MKAATTAMMTTTITTTKRTAMKKANDRSVNSGLYFPCFPRLLRRSLPQLAPPPKIVVVRNNGRRWGPKPRREWVADLVSRNDDIVRSLPIHVGSVSLLAVLINRIVSAIPPDPSSVAIVACDIKKSLDEISVNLSLPVSL
ncbi:hypothetical protein RHGRI_004910 [Rhododendron griersonianum]|uniref:Uncharacterized protein n=1 Tax=Rhododendron griersonianum TaxID=479676 RepID=A0AAV6LD36_9ERIC|nr:hypothetical protein RHGRI_004910 [Rhododendron griersonianum]